VGSWTDVQKNLIKSWFMELLGAIHRPINFFLWEKLINKQKRFRIQIDCAEKKENNILKRLKKRKRK
jgi:hypothetical protein